MERVPGIDFCAYAEDPRNAAQSSHEHLLECNVCFRTVQVLTALVSHWEPLPTEEAEALMSVMAEELVAREAGTDSQEFRGFYAALAKDSMFELRFARIVAEATNTAEKG